jgi:hypothetical protein
MSRYRFATVAALFAVTISSAVYAADEKPAEKKRGTTFIEPDQAGPDYRIQGEYVGGSGGGAKWGAQVAALGDGKFHAVLLQGGLPGEGWDAKTRYESEGQTDGDRVVLHGVEKVAWADGHIKPPGVEVKKGFEVEITGGGDTLNAKTENGETVTLKRTVRHSPTEGLKPPQGATVLFDGSNVDAWKGGKIIEEPASLKGTMKQGGETKQTFTDYTLHVEFYLPFKPFARNQERGNSGVYNQHRYETQVLDSFGVLGYDNECGGVYTKNPPTVNMCYPPLTWQTYDIDFTAARYEGGQKKSDAVITVKHNGVVIHDAYKINGSTGGGQKEKPDEAMQSGPLYLQDHGNPVFFRNVWIVEKK